MEEDFQERREPVLGDSPKTPLFLSVLKVFLHLIRTRLVVSGIENCHA